MIDIWNSSLDWVRCLLSRGVPCETMPIETLTRVRSRAESLTSSSIREVRGLHYTVHVVDRGVLPLRHACIIRVASRLRGDRHRAVTIRGHTIHTVHTVVWR